MRGIHKVVFEGPPAEVILESLEFEVEFKPQHFGP